MIIPDFVEKNAWLYPKKTAIAVPGDRTCTFSELKDRVYRLANGLLQMRLAKGDRVAVLAENCFEYPEIYFGIAKAGGVVTPLNFRFAPPEVLALTAESGARFFIVEDKYAEVVKRLRPKMESVEEFICIGDNAEGMIGYETMMAGSPATNPAIDVGLDDLFCLIHTGGTTGTPKLTMLTHRNLLNCATLFVVESGFGYGDVFMIISPLFHTGASWPLFWTFILGNTFVILKRFDIEELAKAVEENKVTASLWMSQLVPLITSHPVVSQKKYDMSSLRLILVGAAVLPEPHLRGLLEMFPGIMVAGAGGQTECGLFTGIRYDELLDSAPDKLASAGRPGYNMEVKIVDQDDNEVPAGTAGELCVRGEGVMKGYWNKPEESTWSLRGGWQHTGDICKLDQEGYLYYLDRLKDMIKSGGENVYSKEVEDILYTHPAVAEAAVVGVPDDKWGEAVKALIIVKQGQKTDPDELIAHCRKGIAGFKCPKSIEFRDSLPKTPLGKINKKALRKPYWEGLGRKI
jgi:long-chain acyl-CoA synthetase